MGAASVVVARVHPAQRGRRLSLLRVLISLSFALNEGALKFFVVFSLALDKRTLKFLVILGFALNKRALELLVIFSLPLYERALEFLVVLLALHRRGGRPRGCRRRG